MKAWFSLTSQLTVHLLRSTLLVRKSILLLLLFFTLCCGCNSAKQASNTPVGMRILAWNVESGGSDPDVIAKQLQTFSDYDIIGLSEVAPQNFDLFQRAAGANFESITGTNRYDDYLQLLYDASRFELIRSKELHEYRDYRMNNGSNRSPLLVHLRCKITGKDFQVLLNHLARSNDNLRTEQGNGLREWGRDQTLPTIAIGDFNFDYDFHRKTGNEAFRAFMQDGIWYWPKPDPLIDTNWADRNKDGIDDYPDSMLDFCFVAGPAKDWHPESTVVKQENDFPDDMSTSDHRPIVFSCKFAR